MTSSKAQIVKDHGLVTMAAERLEDFDTTGPLTRRLALGMVAMAAERLEDFDAQGGSHERRQRRVAMAAERLEDFDGPGRSSEFACTHVAMAAERLEDFDRVIKKHPDIGTT